MHEPTKESVLRASILEYQHNLRVEISQTLRDKHLEENKEKPDKHLLNLYDMLIDRRYDCIDTADALLDDLYDGKLL